MDEDPQIEDFYIHCDTEVGSADVGYKNGGCKVNVAKALELLLLKKIVILLQWRNYKL